MKTEMITAMSFEAYAAVEACHKSALSHVKTGKHLAKFEKRAEDTDALRFGKIFHEAIFDEKMIDALEVYSEQDWIPKKDHPEGLNVNDQKAAWKKERELYFANEQEKEDAKAMAKAVREHPLAKKYLDKGEVEPSLFWIDERTGLPCKTRFDVLRDDDIVIEIKTDVDPEPEAFGKKIYNMNYHVGAWFNREGFRAVFGRDIKAFIFIVVEKSDPYSVGVYLMNAHDFDAGEIDGVPKMKRYQIIKAGGFQDHNQLENGEYEIRPVHTPKWVEFKLDGDGEIDAPEETEGSEL